MILSDSAILGALAIGDITIRPFNRAHLGSNSYDITLGKTLRQYDGSTILDARKKNETWEREIPEDGFVMMPNTLYLGHTNEVAGSVAYVPMVEGRSSMGRLGLYIHVSAGFGDVGFVNQWTLELVVVQPLRVYAGMRVGQVFFHSVKGKVLKPYSGKYGTETGAVASRAHLDFT